METNMRLFVNGKPVEGLVRVDFGTGKSKTLCSSFKCNGKGEVTWEGELLIENKQEVIQCLFRYIRMQQRKKLKSMVKRLAARAIIYASVHS